MVQHIDESTVQFISQKISNANDYGVEIFRDGIAVRSKEHKKICVFFESREAVADHYQTDLDIGFYSEFGFDNFHNIFSEVKPLDFHLFNKYLFEIQFLHAYISGKQFNNSIKSLDDFKYYFQYDGDNYRHIFDVENLHFLIKIQFILNLKTGFIEEEICYIYTNKELNISCISLDFTDLKTRIFEYIEKKLNKPITDIKLSDYKLFKLITY
jgi:hypothetical protein